MSDGKVTVSLSPEHWTALTCRSGPGRHAGEAVEAIDTALAAHRQQQAERDEGHPWKAHEYGDEAKVAGKANWFVANVHGDWLADYVTEAQARLIAGADGYRREALLADDWHDQADAWQAAAEAQLEVADAWESLLKLWNPSLGFVLATAERLSNTAARAFRIAREKAGQR